VDIAQKGLKLDEVEATLSLALLSTPGKGGCYVPSSITVSSTKTEEDSKKKKKEPPEVATLLVQVPSLYTGGEMRVMFENETNNYDFGLSKGRQRDLINS